MVDINDREQVVLKLHSAMLVELQKANLIDCRGLGPLHAAALGLTPSRKMYFMGYQVVVDDDCPDWEFARKPAT